jgi:hypothetical protein
MTLPYRASATFCGGIFSSISHYPILIGDRLLNIIIHFIDNQQIKIKDVLKREINFEIYKVISKNRTSIYPMPKISFVEVQEK